MTALPSWEGGFFVPDGTDMNGIRRILCPADFTEFSRRAASLAAAWARQFGAEVSALHVRTNGLDRQADAWDGPGKIAGAEGDPGAVILDPAAALSARLLVIGTRVRRAC